MKERVLIVGASTRAAAWSVIRAGGAPVCADMFADMDLRACAEVLPVADYPRGLVAAVADLPPMPFLYTGALENHPRIIEQISRRHRCCGNPADVLRRVRDPFEVAGVLRHHGYPALELRRADDPPPPDGGWLLKPLRGSAGRGIVRWDPAAVNSPTLREPHYFQQFVEGVPCSSLCTKGNQIARLTDTRQLIGDEASHAAPFQYAGSIWPARSAIGQSWDPTPDPETASVEERMKLEGLLAAIAHEVGTELGLHAMFGIDFVVDELHVPWVVEINPRYTASAELLEFWGGLSLTTWGERRLFDAQPWLERDLNGGDAARSPPHAIGKRILYAPHRCRVPDWTARIADPLSAEVPVMADIPAPGSLIGPHEPICTVFAAGPNVESCEARLREQADAVYDELLEA